MPHPKKQTCAKICRPFNPTNKRVLTKQWLVLCNTDGIPYRVFCGLLGWVRCLVVCFLYKTNRKTTKNCLLWEKSGPNATFNLIFLGLGWP